MLNYFFLMLFSGSQTFWGENHRTWNNFSPTETAAIEGVKLCLQSPSHRPEHVGKRTVPPDLNTCQQVEHQTQQCEAASGDGEEVTSDPSVAMDRSPQLSMLQFLHLRPLPSDRLTIGVIIEL